MADLMVTEAEPSMSTLATGIINDVQDLIKQQLSLFQHEIKEGVNKTKDGAFVLFVGLGIALAGVSLAGVTGAYLLHWAAPTLPLWACFAIPSAALMMAGGALVVVGKKMLDAVPTLANQSVDEVKENVQWILKNPAK
jgi:hypothetical protein